MSEKAISGMLVRSNAIRGLPAWPARRNSSWVIDNPSGLSCGGLEPVPVPDDQHIQITGVHVGQAAVPHRVTVRPVTVHDLMLRRHQPVHHRLAFGSQVGDRGRHINLGHHPTPPWAALSP